VLRLDPGFPGVHLELGKVYISLRRTGDAIRELELALKANPATGMRAISWAVCWFRTAATRRESPTSNGRQDEARLLGALFLFGQGQTSPGQGAEAVVPLQRAAALNR